MKLRMRGDSIRFRLTEPEVRTLANAGVVEEIVRFPGATELRYRVEAGAHSDGLHAGFVKSCLWVRLSREAVARWAVGDDVGIEGTQVLGDGGVLRVSVEKDFECLHPAMRRQVEEGAYPHPGRASGACGLRTEGAA